MLIVTNMAQREICEICQKIIRKNSKIVCCDICNWKVHIDCLQQPSVSGMMPPHQQQYTVWISSPRPSEDSKKVSRYRRRAVLHEEPSEADKTLSFCSPTAQLVPTGTPQPRDCFGVHHCAVICRSNNHTVEVATGFLEGEHFPADVPPTLPCAGNLSPEAAMAPDHSMRIFLISAGIQTNPGPTCNHCNKAIRANNKHAKQRN